MTVEWNDMLGLGLGWDCEYEIAGSEQFVLLCDVTASASDEIKLVLPNTVLINEIQV